jgi:glycosyltransferase involved in cell wall biosynthesis
MARSALDKASVVFAGSAHTAGVTREILGEGAYSERIELLPPGVDVVGFAPDRGSKDALLRSLTEHDPGRGARGPDPDVAQRLRSVDRFVLYAGKLMMSKGVGTLIEAWREVAQEHPDLHLVVVGFGDDRVALERQASGLPVVFTGAFSHRELQQLMPLAELAVVPSIVPEAFGMIAAEAAACGVVPLVAAHSGLAEVAEGLGEAGLTFDGSAADLTAGILDFLAEPSSERHRLATIARTAAEERWSWGTIAQRFVSLAAVHARVK